MYFLQSYPDPKSLSCLKSNSIQTACINTSQQQQSSIVINSEKITPHKKLNKHVTQTVQHPQTDEQAYLN